MLAAKVDQQQKRRGLQAWTQMLQCAVCRSEALLRATVWRARACTRLGWAQWRRLVIADWQHRAASASEWEQRWIESQQDLLQLERDELEARKEAHELQASLRTNKRDNQLLVLRLLVSQWTADCLLWAWAAWIGCTHGAKSTSLLMQLQHTRLAVEESLSQQLDASSLKSFNEWKLVANVEQNTLQQMAQASQAAEELSKVSCKR